LINATVNAAVSAIVLVVAKTIIFCRCFLYFIISGSRFFHIFQLTFLTLCHMEWLWFQQNLCYRVSRKVPSKTNGAKPHILPISGPDHNKFRTAVLQRGRKSEI